MINKIKERLEIITRRLAGQNVSHICRSLKHSRDWFYYWWKRFVNSGTEELTNSNNKVPHNRTPSEIEQAIVNERILLENRKYSLIGAPSVQKELLELGLKNIPPVRTIERILQRNGFTVKNEKVKKSSKLKFYPKPLAGKPNDVFEFDLIGPKYLTGSKQKYYYYNIKDTYSKAVFIDAFDCKKSLKILEFLVSAFQSLGVPKILQVDNALEFRGSNRHPRGFSKLIRLCLLLGIEVLFIPEGIPQYNGSVENFNGFVDRNFIRIQELKSLRHIKSELVNFRNIANERHPHEALDYRTSNEARKGCKIHKLSKNFKEHSGKMSIYPGKISFIRLVRKSGRITVLNEIFFIGKRKKYQFVKATIFTRTQKLKIYLRGKLIKEFDYRIPQFS